MKFVTSVDIAPSQRKIAYDDKILLLGSCFADNIGEKFLAHYFQTTINPFGTLYNPASIALSLSDCRLPIPDAQMIYHNGLWHSMMHHGSFSHPDKDVVIKRCEQSQIQLRTALQQASTIIVTFGTSWLYEMDGMVVANCHKLPANRFTRRRMTAEEIVAMWQPIIASMPDKQWIFTVSPIRHIKDGLHDNQLSKAILLQAIDALTSSPNSLLASSPLTYTAPEAPLPSTASPARITYFPAYEIMLDELRDYRFYAEDMVHPSAVAVDYIWQRFVETYMLADTQSEMRVLHQLWMDSHHRCLHPDSEEAQRFSAHVSQRRKDLQKRYPWID